MKTKNVASFLAILAATFLGLNATGQTVQNPGFETSGGTTTGAANWNGAGSGGAIATPYYVQASDAHAGANCLVVEGQGNGVGAGPVVSQDGVTPVVAGTLTLSFYAKASIMNGGGNAQYQISWRNAADAQIGVSGFASFPSALNTSTYTLETISGLTAPANADHCTILLLIAVGAGSGDHWKVQLDDVSLVQNTIATPSTAINYPTNNAPTPTDAPSSVLSMYNSSGTYTDHSGIGWYASWSGVSSMADYTITNTGGRTVKSYLGLSYAGVEFYNPNQINATAYNTLHVDVWTTANQLAIKLVSTDNGAAPEVIIPASSGTITTNHWVSLDIPLSSFKALAPTLDLTNLDQMLWVDNGDISGPGIQNGSFYFDNVYFYSNAVVVPPPLTHPTNNAPTPTRASTSVLSMYNSSGTYTDHSGIGWYASWSGVSSMADYTITNTGGRTVKSYLGLSYAGVEFYNPNQINATAYNTLHVDVWTTANQLAIKLVSTDNGAAPEVIIPASSGTITTNHWVSLDIPLSSFKALAPTLDLTNLDQMLWVDNGDISGPGIQNGSFYFDNVYFYATATATSPTIVIPAVVGGNFTVQSASQTGFNYILQATPTLSPATWTGVQTNAGTGGTLNFSVPTSGNPQRFFRIKVQ